MRAAWSIQHSCPLRGGTSRLAPFTQVLLGFSKERNYSSGGSDPHFSASATLGLDLRAAPPLTVRLAVRHQEIPGDPSERGSSARNTGLFVGLGFTGWGGRSESQVVGRR